MHNIFEALGREVELVPIGELRPWPGNARRHTKKQVRKLADTGHWLPLATLPCKNAGT